MRSITVRVEFSEELREPQRVAEAVAREVAAAFRDGTLRWRTHSAAHGVAAVTGVEAWPTRE